jgi:hypothetical protein
MMHGFAPKRLNSLPIRTESGSSHQ